METNAALAVKLYECRQELLEGVLVTQAKDL